MSVRVQYTVSVAVSSTSAGENDLGNTSWQVVTNQEAKGGTWKTTLAPSVTDVLLQIDNISTIQLLVLRTTTTNPNDTPSVITFKKNSTGGEVTTIKPLGDAVEGHLVLSTDAVTAIYVSNPGTVSMDLTVIAVGA